MEERQDEEAKLLYAMSGKGLLLADGQSMPLVAPCMMLLPVGCPHRIVDAPGAPLSLTGLGFHPEQFVAGELVQRVCAQPWVLDAPALQSQLGDLVRELLMEERRGADACRATQLSAALRLLLLLDRTGHAAEEAAGRVQRRLAQARREVWKRPDLDRAAAESGLSRRRFSQLCRELQGESWGEFLMRQRMEHAGVLLLSEAELAIRRVAFECGYHNLSVFHRDFKAFWGHTPSEHRKSG